jgi:hypothetical protein
MARAVHAFQAAGVKKSNKGLIIDLAIGGGVLMCRRTPRLLDHRMGKAKSWLLVVIGRASPKSQKMMDQTTAPRDSIEVADDASMKEWAWPSIKQAW